MRVQVVTRTTDTRTGEVKYEPYRQMPECGFEAELKEYINKKSGLPDPVLVYGEGRWVHFSTVVKPGRHVQNIATGELIEIENLSPW